MAPHKLGRHDRALARCCFASQNNSGQWNAPVARIFIGLMKNMPSTMPKRAAFDGN